MKRAKEHCGGVPSGGAGATNNSASHNHLLNTTTTITSQPPTTQSIGPLPHLPVFGVGENGSSAMRVQKKSMKTIDSEDTAVSSWALFTSSATGKQPAIVTTPSIMLREGSAPGGIIVPA